MCPPYHYRYPHPQQCSCNRLRALECVTRRAQVLGGSSAAEAAAPAGGPVASGGHLGGVPGAGRLVPRQRGRPLAGGDQAEHGGQPRPLELRQRRGARVSPHEERQLLPLRALRYVQRLPERVQEKGDFSCYYISAVLCSSSANQVICMGGDVGLFQTSVKGIRSIVSFSARKETAAT